MLGVLSALLLGCGVKVGDPELEHRSSSTIELDEQKARELGMDPSDCTPPSEQPLFRGVNGSPDLIANGKIQSMNGNWTEGSYNSWNQGWQESFVGEQSPVGLIEQGKEAANLFQRLNHGFKLTQFSNGQKMLSFVYKKEIKNNVNDAAYTCHFRITASTYKVESCLPGEGYDCSKVPYFLSFPVDQIELLLSVKNLYVRDASKFNCSDFLAKAQWDLRCKSRIKTVLIQPEWDTPKTFSSFSATFETQSYRFKRK